MKSDRHVVTDEEYELFKAKVREYVNKLGLHEWKVYTERRYDKGGSDGELWNNTEQRKATIYINTTIHRLETIEYIAAHEVCELLLSQLRDMALGCNNSMVVSEFCHEVINHITRLLMGEKP